MANRERFRGAMAATGITILIAGCGTFSGHADSPQTVKLQYETVHAAGSTASSSSPSSAKSGKSAKSAKSTKSAAARKARSSASATASKSAKPSVSASPPPVQIKTTAQCGSAAPETPGGADPWGGCWPGPSNTGPSVHVSIKPYAGKVLSDGACMIYSNTVISGKRLACQIVIRSGNLTLENSELSGEVYNYGSGSVLIENSTINGGDDETESVLGSNITIENSNLYGNQHEVYCSDNCTIENSWLHDNHNFGDADHQNGFLTTDGSGYNLQHNSIFCAGHCTGDVTFLGSDSAAVVNKNLLVATDAAYCLYPGSDGSAVIDDMTVTNNVFQLGSNGKCATYGPVYAWNEPNNNPGTSGYRNVWSGNIWSNGKRLPEP
jgi:hypothetical protein